MNVATTAAVVSPPVPAEEVPALAPTAKAPATAAIVDALAVVHKWPTGHILDSVLEVVKSSGSFVDPNLVGSGVEVVGTGESKGGRACGAHYVCGTTPIRMRSYVCFSKIRFA